MKKQHSSSHILICENLSKVYGSEDKTIQIIKPTSFSIEKGTKNLIMGKSGSGKTTLLTMLAGIELPTDGSVYYQGIDFYSLSEKKQARIRGVNYGFVFQAFHLLPELTVQDNIRVPLIINGGTLDVEFYENIIALMQLEAKITAYPSELSGGEQQRVAIARAMILKPSILFADEPTGNLDHQNSLRIIKLIEELNDSFGTTIIMVTHDSQLMKNADCKFEIYDGIVTCETQGKGRE